MAAIEMTRWIKWYKLVCYTETETVKLPANDIRLRLSPFHLRSIS